MLNKFIKQISILAVVCGCLAIVKPVLASNGYESTIPDCATTAAADNVTLEVYTTFTAATANSITAEFIPSFTDENCTVKLPIGYDTFGGVTVAVTSDIQTAVGDEEIQVTLNADSSGEYQHTFTGLDPYKEYQFRVDGIYTKSSDATQYNSTSDSVYYSTAGAPVTDLAVADDGTFSWTNPTEGDEGNIKIDLTGLDSDGNVVMATTKYATSGESYEYYDFVNDFYNGDYVLIATASMKKVYDGVDQRVWGTPVILSFSTVNGSVVRSSTIHSSVTDVSDCAGLDAGETCTVTGDVVPNKPTILKATQTKLKWAASAGASSYKITFIGKNGKLIAKYKDVTSLSVSFSSSKTIVKVKVQACNAFGCSAATKKTL